jgi:hypothetical protein
MPFMQYGQIRSDRSLLWPPMLAASTAGLLLVGMAVGALGMIPWVPVAPEEALEAIADPSPVRRCPECGWIESKRSIESGADNRAIRSQEYTVRMADGSSRVFTGGPLERWRVGERLKFIDGGQ